MQVVYISVISVFAFCFLYFGNVSAQSFSDYAKSVKNEFDDYQTQLNKDFEQFKKIYDEEFNKFTGKVNDEWGDKIVSDDKVWVEYSADMKTRKIINFETGEITVQIKDKKADNVMLATELANFITEDISDANKNDILSANIEKRIKESNIKAEQANAPQGNPIILSLVDDKIDPKDMKAVAAVAVDMVKNGSVKQETLSTGAAAVTLITSVAVDEKQDAPSNAVLTANTNVGKIHKKAGDYKDFVEKYAADRKMPEALVFAVIHNESSFNPKAVSHVPAYGLMQLVPKSGGAEAASVYFGKHVILAPSYFYNPENNIKLGSTYLSQLYYNYFKNIKDPEVRLYCTICAYNTGPGNVSRAFIGSTKLGNAISVINEKTPKEAYNILLNKLPYEETRNYLKKVSSSYNAYYEY